MKIRLPLILMFVICFPLVTQLTEATDGIPDNCENTRAEFYRENVFARYEPQNRSLVLVDWSNNSTVQTLATDLHNTLIRGWSWDCRYLATATGDPNRYDTIVYDTQTGQLVDVVPDAQTVPHTITWGPRSFLVVESRHGAVIWDVPRNLQYRHDTGFHTTLHRNFTELRWDTDSMQLTANLAVGGKRTYDLLTGEETALTTRNIGEIIIGGEKFFCKSANDRYNTNAQTVSSLRLGYAREGGVISIRKYRYPEYRSEILETIEADVQALSVSDLRWSANCRYLAGSIRVNAVPDVYETVVWEFETKRRVGSFDDAREIPHRIHWDTAEKHVLVQTRNGAYLWNLETNQRLLVTDEVEQVCTSSYSCRIREPKSFHQVYWDAGREQLLGVPVTTPSSVVMYDINTGVEVERYSIDGVNEPIHFITSNDSRLLAIYNSGQITLINRNTGERTQLSTIDIASQDFTRQVAISTDNNYLVLKSGADYYVWDLNRVEPYSPPTRIYEQLQISGGSSISFINSSMIETSGGGRLNIVTGEVSGNLYYGYGSSSFDPETQTTILFTELDGVSGNGILRGRGRTEFGDCAILPYYRKQERQLVLNNTITDETLIIADDFNRVFSMHLSPNCQTLYTAIQLRNTSLPYNETPGDVSTENYIRRTYIVLWDVESGLPIITLDNTGIGLSYSHKIGSSYTHWSPDGQYMLIRFNGQYHMVDIAEQVSHPVQFFDSSSGYLPASAESYWDYSRGLVYIEGFGEIFALDMKTGLERIRFEVGYCSFTSRDGCMMDISDDGQYIFGYGNSRMSAWNIDTLAHVYLPVESGRNTRHRTYVSPNQQYIIVGRSAIRSWTFEGEELTMFGFGAQSFISLEFIDETTIEIVIPTDTATETRRYNLITGERLG